MLQRLISGLALLKLWLRQRGRYDFIKFKNMTMKRHLGIEEFMWKKWIFTMTIFSYKLFPPYKSIGLPMHPRVPQWEKQTIFY